MPELDAVQGNGVGTVMSGHYLVTHNHYRAVPLQLLADPQRAQNVIVTVYEADGGVLFYTRGDRLSVALDEPGTLVLDFGVLNGKGRFAVEGVDSAEFGVVRAQEVRAHHVVAQIDREGERLHVNWAPAVIQCSMDGVGTLVMSSCIQAGSSGGGVFVDGVHIGNNWKRRLDCGDRAYSYPMCSTIALNPPALLALP